MSNATTAEWRIPTHPDDLSTTQASYRAGTNVPARIGRFLSLWRQLRDLIKGGLESRTARPAAQVLERLADILFAPERLVLTVEGNAAFYFFGRDLVDGGAHRRYAVVECSDEDTVSVALVDRALADPVVFAVELSADEEVDVAISRVREFVQG